MQAVVEELEIENENECTFSRENEIQEQIHTKRSPHNKTKRLKWILYQNKEKEDKDRL